MDNRYIFLGGLILDVFASLLMADWQAIDGDPCDKFSGHCENQNASTFDVTFIIEENQNNGSVLLIVSLLSVQNALG